MDGLIKSEIHALLNGNSDGIKKKIALAIFYLLRNVSVKHTTLSHCITIVSLCVGLIEITQTPNSNSCGVHSWEKGRVCACMCGVCVCVFFVSNVCTSVLLCACVALPNEVQPRDLSHLKAAALLSERGALT